MSGNQETAKRAPLSLHHLTALDLAPADLVSLAAELGCSHVGLFVHLPAQVRARFPLVGDAAGETLVRRRLDETGVRVNNLEVFALAAGTDLAEFRPALERGLRLGARQATVHIHEPDEARAVAAFTAFCDLAADYGLLASLEFTSFAQVRTLAQAVRIVEAAGRENGVIAIDALHFFRNGGQPGQVAALDPGRIGYVQLCDGPRVAPADLYAEAVNQRLVPGAGEFPLEQLIGALPSEVLLDVEVPQHLLRDLGMNVRERASRAVMAARELIARTKQ